MLDREDVEVHSGIRIRVCKGMDKIMETVARDKLIFINPLAPELFFFKF